MESAAFGWGSLIGNKTGTPGKMMLYVDNHGGIRDRRVRAAIECIGSPVAIGPVALTGRAKACGCGGLWSVQ
jgi:hypothetical protein